MVLTGSGQGVPSDADWATAYIGPGPWGSLAPALPSVPSQALEGIATLAILAGLAVVLLLGAFRRRDGRLYFAAIGLWAVARALVSTTWRDPVVAAGLNAGGLIAVGIAIGCAVALRGHDRSRRKEPVADDGRRLPLTSRGRTRARGRGSDGRVRRATRARAEEYRDGFLRRGHSDDTGRRRRAQPPRTIPTPGRVSHWIGGRVVAGTSGREGPVYDPATGRHHEVRRLRLGQRGRRRGRGGEGGLPGLARDLALQAHRHHVQDPEPGRGASPGASPRS